MSRLAYSQVAVSGTAAQLSTDASVEASIILIKPLSTNVNDVYIGDANVTTSTGYPLAPGEVYRLVYTNQAGTGVVDLKPSDLYAVGTSGDRVAWQALRK